MCRFAATWTCILQPNKTSVQWSHWFFITHKFCVLLGFWFCRQKYRRVFSRAHFQHALTCNLPNPISKYWRLSYGAFLGVSDFFKQNFLFKKKIERTLLKKSFCVQRIFRKLILIQINALIYVPIINSYTMNQLRFLFNHSWTRPRHLQGCEVAIDIDYWHLDTALILCIKKETELVTYITRTSN